MSHEASRRSVAALFAAVALVAAPTFAFAQAAAAPPPPPPRQEGSAELAYVGTSGNSSTKTLSLGAEHLFRPDGWTIRNKFLSVNSTSEGATTAESLNYIFRAEHTINARVSAFGDYRYFDNEPAGVAHRNSVAGGVLFKLVEQARQSLTADTGIGYLNEQRIGSADISTATWEAGALYKLKLSANSDLSNEARLLTSFDNSDDWRAVNAFALTAKINSLFSLKFANVVRYSHFPPAGFKTTDTTTSIALVASFKKQ